MPGNIVNFNKARKAKARKQKDIRAAENRVKFGRKKTEKEQADALAKNQKNHLDGHKREKPNSDD